jgi:hypothetical protein
MMTQAEHLDAKCYVVRWLDQQRRAGVSPKSRPGLPNAGLPAGWYVVRCCPCHWGEPVVVQPYPDKERAERGRQIILSVTP